MKNIILLISLILLLSCSDFTSETRYQETKYTITGLLYEGRSISPAFPITVGKTIDAEGGNIEDLFVTDAEVLLINTASSDTIALSFYAEIPDSTSDLIFGFIDPNWETNPMPIIPRNTYRVEVTIPTPDEPTLIYAETTIPDPIVLNPLQDEGFTSDFSEVLPEISYETANQEHPLQIGVNDDEPINLYFEYYCLEDYTNAYYIQDLPGTADTPEEEDDYEDPVEGFPRKIKWWYSYQAEWDEEADQFLISDRGYKSNFIFYGKYEIQVYAIDENYYHYLYKTDGLMHGGIHNGYGYFGSCSGGTLYTEIVQ